jgi:hypothetical protein
LWCWFNGKIYVGMEDLGNLSKRKSGNWVETAGNFCGVAKFYLEKQR